MRAGSTGNRLGVRGSLIVVLAATAVACGGGSGPGGGAKEPASGEGSEGGDLSAQFERETEPAEKHAVKAPGAFVAMIEGKAPPKVERAEKSWSISVDAGFGGSELQCLVYDDVIDPGTAAYAMVKAAAKDVTFKSLAPYFLEPLDLEPIIGIRGLYHVERDGTLLAGDIKLAVLARSERPMACWHDAPGYAKSFARVTSQFAKSFQFQRTQPSPMRAELWATSLEGMPIGFGREGVYLVEDGTMRKVSLSARFLPAGPGEMAFEDEVQVLGYDKDGTLATGKYMSIENGETNLNIDVEKTKTGYNYVGTIQGKEVKGSFKTKTPVKVQRAVENKLKAVAKDKKKAKFEQWEYHPSLDASKGTLVTYEVTPESDGMTIVTSVGKRSATLKGDARGVVKQVLFAVGQRQLKVELLEEKGEL
jgi:hypothetical protein